MNALIIYFRWAWELEDDGKLEWILKAIAFGSKILGNGHWFVCIFYWPKQREYICDISNLTSWSPAGQMEAKLKQFISHIKREHDDDAVDRCIYATTVYILGFFAVSLIWFLWYGSIAEEFQMEPNAFQGFPELCSRSR